MSGITYGQNAVELLRTLQRAKNIPPYEESVIQESIREITALDQEMRHVASEHGSDAISSAYVGSNLLVHYTAVKRLKRVILAYLMHRLRLVQLLRWDVGSTIIPPKLLPLLSPNEITFFDSYQQLLARLPIPYQTSSTPPVSLYLQVKVKADWGDVVTEDGIIGLTKGSVQYVRRRDVEGLVKQGVVEHVEW